MKVAAPKFAARLKLSQIVARARQILKDRAPEALSLVALLVASACDAHPQHHPAAAPSPRTAKHAAEHLHGKYEWYAVDTIPE